MATNIYPSETPVGTFFSEAGNRIREYQLARWFRDCNGTSLERFVYSGLDISDPNTGLVVGVALGVAVIDGFRVYLDASSTISSLTDSTTNYLFLSLAKTGDLVTGSTLSANTTGTVPTDGVLIGWCTTSGGQVTAVNSAPKKPSIVFGSYAGTGSNPLHVIVGVTPKFGLVWGNSIFGSVVGSSDYGFYIASGDTNRGLGGSSDYYPQIETHGFVIPGTLHFNASAVNYSYAIFT